MPDAAGSTTWPADGSYRPPSTVAPARFTDHVTLPARIRLDTSRRVDLSNHAAWAYIIGNNGYDPRRDECDDRVVDDAISLFPNEQGRGTQE